MRMDFLDLRRIEIWLSVLMYNSKKILDLTTKELAKLFGTTEKELVTYCGDLIESSNFHYRKVKSDKRDQLILKVFKLINSKELATAGPERQPDWEKGWSENLKEFVESGYDVDKLVPKYFKKNVPVRFNRDYVIPVNQNFEYNLIKLLRSWLFQKYFREVDSIYEFGCGPASHLVFLATLFPDKKLYGFDWAKSSQEIISLLAQQYGWDIQGDYFNFFDSNEDLTLEPNSAVFTFGALEQVGKNHGPFLDFLLRKSPGLCVNVEGLHELYEQDDLLDYLALEYHKHRNYLYGYLTRLRELEKKGKIKIVKIHRQLFGNLFDNPHSYVIWKPKK